MKENIKLILERLFLGWLIVGVIGLAISVVSLMVNQDQVYFIGLVVAMPVYLFGLGLAMLVVLMYVFGIVQILRWLTRKCTRRPGHNSDRKFPE